MAGLYGKLPSHGDFLHCGLRDSFVNAWDAWLQAGVARSRLDLGEQWLGIFLTSPVWRFALSSGIIDGAAWAGVILPSVDRVGRYFPLTIAAELPPGARPFDVSVEADGWYASAEALGRRALTDEITDLDRLCAELEDSEALLDPRRFVAMAPHQALPAIHREPTAGGETASGPADGGACGACGRFALPGRMPRFFAQLAASLIGADRRPVTLWWSDGSDHVAPAVLIERDLPPAHRFRDLLVDAPAAGNPTVAPAPAAIGAPPSGTLRLASAAATDTGRWRAENQDAYGERLGDAVWVVADGMGGHADGALASATVVEHVRAASLSGDAASRSAALRSALLEANAELRRRAAAEPGFDAGSTVIAMCLGMEEGRVLWAGDSRLYRLRGGSLAQLTQDHSAAAEAAREGASAGAEHHVITRAVGGADVLELDERRFDVRSGDRLLLCTDGLYGDLSAADIAAGMAAGDCGQAVARLIALALERGGRDNATAVLIAVQAASGERDAE